MSKGASPDSPISLGQRSGLSHDGRTDLGYASTSQKFHSPRAKGSSFPYSEEVEEDDIEELEIEDSTAQRINNKIATPYKSSDHLIGRSIDHSSLVGGNSRVAISEAVAKGLVPFPGMYKKRIQVGGGANSPKLVSPGQYNRTGTYRGWSHAPIPAEDMIQKNDDDSDNENLEKVRNIVRSILKNNVTET
jgi:hypothetical protein